MKTKVFLFIMSYLFIAHACYEDKGNYDYITPYDVKPATGYFRGYASTCYLGERYVFYPQLEYSNPSDTTRFKFWWEFTGTLSTQAYDTLCIGRELNFVPTTPDYINMRLCILDTITNIISSHSLQIQCFSSIGKGWAILSEKNEQSSISLIRPEYKETTNPDGQKIKTRFYVPLIDVYATLQNEPLGTGPLQIRQLLNSNGNILLVMQESGSVYLNGGNHEKEMLLEKEFAGGMPSDFSIKDFFYGTSTDVISSTNGYLYTRTTREQAEFQPFYRSAFVNIPVEYQGEKIKATTLIPTVPTKAQFFGIYEASKKRILWMILERNKASMIAKTEPLEVGEDETIIDPSDLKDGELIYCGAYTNNTSSSDASSYFTGIFKKGEDVIVETFCATTNWPDYEFVKISDVKSASFSGKKYISDKTKYYMLATRSYLFFAEKNVIYWYDLNSGITKDFYYFPTGSVVVDMSSNPQENELGVILENGVFATLNIANEKLYDGIKIWDVDGLGKCIDLEYRFGDYNKYVSRTYSHAWD